MAYNASVPADNLPIKDIPGAIREKGKELAGIGDGYPPVVNADKLDGYDASQTPSPNTIPVTGGDGLLPASFVKIIDGVTAGNGLVKSGQTISMETPLTCTNSTTNSFPASGGHTHAITFPAAPEAASPAFAFYENFAGHTLAATNISTYTLVKTFTIPIPKKGVYIFDCAYKVLAWGGTLSSVKVELTGGTMIFGENGATYSEVLPRLIVGQTEGTENHDGSPIYEPINVVKRPSLSGRMVYFAAAGSKTLKVYMKGYQGFKISNFCLGVIGAGT